MKLDLGTIFNLLQLMGGIILSVGYVPQIAKTIKTRSVKDFSLFYFGALWTGIALMEMYAIYNLTQGVAMMFFVTNTIALTMESCMLVLILIFGRADRKAKKQAKREQRLREFAI